MYLCITVRKKMKKIIILILLILSFNSKVYAKSELKLGALLPLSGEHAILGNKHKIRHENSFSKGVA